MNNLNFTKTFRKQNTLAQPVKLSGIGLHTGQEVTMTFRPAKEDAGIFFRRGDLPGHPPIPAHVDFVCDTARSTTIGIANKYVHTIEHVLAAIRAYEIDNLDIEMSSFEPPIHDGSSLAFVSMIEQAGVEEQKKEIPIFKIQRPVFWSEKDIHLVLLPYEGYRISYTLNYPESKALKSQYHSILVTKESFKQEIAPCRTFSLYQEISMLMDKGLIKGGSLDNAVVIQDDAIFSKDGLRFPDEMVRHKILDLIGDLALVGMSFEGHVISVRSGHASNFQLAKQINNLIKLEMN